MCQPIENGEESLMALIVNDGIVCILVYFVFVASNGVDVWGVDSRRECPVVDGVG